MTDAERELDFQLGDLQRENAALRRQLSAAMDETLHLRHTLQHIYAKAMLGLQSNEVAEHDDESSY
jgi:hypothetical protein|tara:strand:+ start:1892 stop:2089 length:198 start_codon:yes stop_codon:yes gene_type:complete